MKILELKHVAYAVEQKQILQDVNFAIDEHAFLTLVGPSGSGKSTTLKLIASLISPSEGQILYKQKNINDLEPVKYRRQVSYCFQEPSLFGKTVRENLNFPYQIRKKEVDEQRLKTLLKQVDLSGDFLDKDITSLSGGEKQRVALIRNLVFLPEVLLLDEVTTGLDDQSKEIVHGLIKNVHQKGVTILQVTHDQSEIKAASKTIKMQKGGIVK